VNDTDRAAPGAALLPRMTLIGGIVTVAVMLVGPIGYRLGLMGIGTAVLGAPAVAALLGAVTLLLGVVTIALSLRRGTARRAPIAIGMVLAGAVFFQVLGQFSLARSAPMIHDITTSPADPPAFVALVDERTASPNGVDYDFETLPEPTRTAYPAVVPLATDLPPDAAFARSVELVEALGWALVAADADEGRIEATDTTFFYGFKDDIVIRVRPTDDGGASIDLRSASRVGQSDLGANAARIEAFLALF
jgi:uncharacterized protein (DUF1499 family)